MFKFKLTLVLTVCFSLCWSRHFEYPEDGNPCVLLDIDFNIELTAFKDGITFAMKRLTSDDANITVGGDCDVSLEMNTITLNFPETSKFAIAFQPHAPYAVGMYKGMFFKPKEAFGVTIDVSEEQTFVDPTPVYLNDKTHSYFCNEFQVAKYDTFCKPCGFNFAVSVEIYSITAQGMAIEGSSYGPQVTCQRSVLSSSSPFRSTELTHHDQYEPKTTFQSILKESTRARLMSEPSAAPVNTYNVKDGDRTCITMRAAITITIKYPATSPVLSSKEAVINIPQDAIATGSCSETPATETLNIFFLDNWNINITFTRYEVLRHLGKPAESYGVSNMQLRFTSDEVNFPSSLLARDTSYTVNTTSSDPNFPSTRDNSDFYSCENVTAYTLTDTVTIKMKYLQFKAFNTDSSAEFLGKATECDAGETGQSGGLNSGVLIGIMLIGVATLTIIAVVILYMQRRRKLRYDTIQ